MRDDRLETSLGSGMRPFYAKLGRGMLNCSKRRPGRMLRTLIQACSLHVTGRECPV